MKNVLYLCIPYCGVSLLAGLLLLTLPASAQWRSQLYPTNWQPVDAGGSPDNEGRFLHDFSYAGYRMGEAAIPNQIGSLTDVTQPPYNVDNTGGADVTLLIQQAIDDVGQSGGGTVYLPAGTYRLTTGSRNYGLRLNRSNVLLKGAGPGQTYLFVDQQNMRQKAAILAAAFGDEVEPNIWNNYSAGNEILLSEDHLLPTKTIKLTSVAGLAVGDWIVLNTVCSNAWAAEHGLQSDWGNKLDGITYYRRIIAVNTTTNSIQIDIPTRYYLKTRDQARVFKLTVDPITEVGLSGFSIGQRQNEAVATSGYRFNDYNNPDKPAYHIHGAHLISFNMVVDGWLTNVQSYRPAVNTNDLHMPSNGIVLSQSRNVTVDNVKMSRPQITNTGGGNGYAYTHLGSDNLIVDAIADRSRHSYSAKGMWSSGNVLKDCQITNGHLEADFHMHFCHANLVENFRGEDFEADYRPFGTINHGHTSAENVFWRFNKTSQNYQVKSQQWGWGYVIGADKVWTPDPTQGDTVKDFAEGTGMGSTLEPQSLYSNQLARRLNTPPPAPNLGLADAYVQGGTNSGTAYGTTDPTNLTVKNDNSSDFTRQAYLRFPLADVPATASSVRLRLHTLNAGTDITQTNLEVRFVSDDSWSEDQITFSNKPAAAEVLDTQPGRAGTLEWDITGRALSEKSGDGFLSLQITSTSSGNQKFASFFSKETANVSLHPALIVDGPTEADVILLEDAYVRRGSNSNNTYGVSDPSKLLVKNSSNSSFSRETVVKFDVSTVATPVNSAKLRLYHSSFDQVHSQTNVSIGAYVASTDIWTEDAVTADDIAASGSVLDITSVSAGTVDSYVEWNITSLVDSRVQGDGIVSLVLKGTQNNENVVSFHSKENSNAPQLVVNGSPAARAASSDKTKVLKDEITTGEGLQIYPNPVHDQFRIQFLDIQQGAHLTIYTLQGKRLLYQTVSPKDVVDVSNLSPGLYLVNLQQNDRTVRRKLLIE